MAKRKLHLGGREVTGEEIEFEAEREAWNTYVLHDGTALKLKVVLSEVFRVEGEYAPNGDPLYMANASLIVSTNAPENLKKKLG